MRTKNGLVVGLILLAAVLAATCGGCSPTIQQWVDRGNAGIVLAQQNQTAWYQAALDQLAKDRNASVEIAFTELRTTMANGIPTSQPATTRPIDSDWIITQEKLLLATLAAYDERKADLDAKYQTAMRNLSATAECFSQIQRLNRAWASDQVVLQEQVQSLTALVEAIAAKQK